MNRDACKVYTVDLFSQDARLYISPPASCDHTVGFAQLPTSCYACWHHFPSNPNIQLVLRRTNIISYGFSYSFHSKTSYIWSETNLSLLFSLAPLQLSLFLTLTRISWKHQNAQLIQCSINEIAFYVIIYISFILDIGPHLLSLMREHSIIRAFQTHSAEQSFSFHW